MDIYRQINGTGKVKSRSLKISFPTQERVLWNAGARIHPVGFGLHRILDARTVDAVDHTAFGASSVLGARSPARSCAWLRAALAVASQVFDRLSVAGTLPLSR
jgi:hypothetical protein